MEFKKKKARQTPFPCGVCNRECKSKVGRSKSDQ